MRFVARSLAAITFLVLFGCTPAPPVAASSSSDPPDIDPQLATVIAGIKAIDNHGHPVLPALAGQPPDKDYDALPVESLEAQSEPIRVRPDSPAILQAHRAIFHGDKPGALRVYDKDYANHVLDELNIQTMLANRVALGPGLAPPRFLWVPFADALMYPLPTAALAQNSDQKAFFALEDRLLKRYYAESGITSKPKTLDQYLDKVVRATLERQRKAGAVAEKFEMAYLRTLGIGNPTKAQASRIYATGKGDYKILQDYIFRYIAIECGQLGMAIHFHSDAGGGGYFNVAGGNPMLLEPLFDDPYLRRTNFVLLHGGWPFEHELTALLTKPNVYVDFSNLTYINYARESSQAIRDWLEYVPEKVLFGTDAYPYSPPTIGWEESGWVANQTGREALGIALTGMLNDGEITRDRAYQLANMVLRDNARKLYGLK